MGRDGSGLADAPRIATPSSLLVLHGEPGSVISLVPLLLHSPQDTATPLKNHTSSLAPRDRFYQASGKKEALAKTSGGMFGRVADSVCGGKERLRNLGSSGLQRVAAGCWKEPVRERTETASREIARLPGNGITSSANLITGSDIGNWPGVWEGRQCHEPCAARSSFPIPSFPSHRAKRCFISPLVSPGRLSSASSDHRGLGIGRTEGGEHARIPD